MAGTKPVIDAAAAEKMNLTVLRRLDPDVEQLLATAGHVALYDFEVTTKKWSRKDVEGSLFLVKRRSQPRFQFVILNKKSADNFVEDVMGGFQCEVQPPYLLYRNKAGEVVGIWFFDQADCDRISGLLQKIASTFAAPSAAPAGAAALANGGGGGGRKKGGAAAATPATPSTAAAAEEQEDGGFWDKPMPAEAAAAAERSERGSSAPTVYAPVAVRGAVAIPPPPAGQQQQQPGAEAGGGGDGTLQRLFDALRAAAPPPRPQSPLPQGDAAEPGSLLLKNLLNKASLPQPGDCGVAPTAASLARELSSGGGVDVGEAVDRVLRSKVAGLLRSLAHNDEFVGLLAAELKKAGLV
eukprot:scaffold8.g1721.t1